MASHLHIFPSERVLINPRLSSLDGTGYHVRECSGYPRVPSRDRAIRNAENLSVERTSSATADEEHGNEERDYHSVEGKCDEGMPSDHSAGQSRLDGHV